jgi:DNA polymerase III delta prime subunit
MAKNALQTVLSNLKAGRDILIGDVNVNLSLLGQRSAQPKTIDWSIAAKLMERQATDVENRLEQMLFGIAAIGLTPTPQEVAKLAATKILTIDETNPEIIDPIRPILDVYDRPSINGSLLILGTPGAGKTTTLLSLAQQLIGRELTNLQQGSPKTVIPLIFELSTWRDDQQSIGDWLVAQLYENYGGDRKSRVYETWLEKQVLLPLLDGLDELGLVRQQKCTEQINQFARTYPQMVVCCRVKEFRQVGVKLSNLRGAVQLEPLSDRQIESYLAAVGKSALWKQIQTVPEMHNLLQPVVDPKNPDYDEPGLLRVPLFISLAAQVFEADRPLKGKADLFDRYIENQLSFDVRVSDRRKEVQKRDWAFKTVEQEPDRREVMHSLIWIAKRLQAGNQVELLIEKMQPSWLASDVKVQYEIALGLIIGMTSWLFANITMWLAIGNNVITWRNEVLSIIFGMYLGLSSSSETVTGHIVPVESFRISMSNKTQKIIPHPLRFFLIVAGALGLILGPFLALTLQMIKMLMFVPAAFLIFGLIFGLIGEFFNLREDLIIRSKPNQGIWNSCKMMIFSSLTIALGFAIFIFFVIVAEGISKGKVLESLTEENYFKLTYGVLSIGSVLGFIGGGGLAVIQHLCLRIILTRHHKIPWNLAQFLTYCHDRRLLQQIGGRYRFIHRELLDHFAEMKN